MELFYAVLHKIAKHSRRGIYEGNLNITLCVSGVSGKQRN